LPTVQCQAPGLAASDRGIRPQHLIAANKLGIRPRHLTTASDRLHPSALALRKIC